MGAIETMMIDSAYCQIGKYFGLPTHAYMGLSDSKVLDSQAGLESCAGALLAALSGINVISGPGMLNFESTHSLEKLVIDNEICGMALRMIEGIAQREETVAEELFGDIYKGDHFLSSESTIKWHRKEYFSPSNVIDRDVYLEWERAGRKSAGDRAHETVQNMLKEKPETVPEPAQKKELFTIMENAAKNYGAKIPEKLPR